MNDHQLGTLIKAIGVTGGSVILLWVLAKSLGWINTPMWIQLLPTTASAVTIAGSVFFIGAGVQRFSSRLLRVERGVKKNGRLIEQNRKEIQHNRKAIESNRREIVENTKGIQENRTPHKRSNTVSL